MDQRRHLLAENRRLRHRLRDVEKKAGEALEYLERLTGHVPRLDLEGKGVVATLRKIHRAEAERCAAELDEMLDEEREAGEEAAEPGSSLLKFRTLDLIGSGRGDV